VKPVFLFAADEHYNDRKNNADDNACSQGEIEGKMFAFIEEVAGEPSYPRYFPSQQEKHSNACDDKTDDEENFADTGYIKHSMPL
jgi:hypothetical protein